MTCHFPAAFVFNRVIKQFIHYDNNYAASVSITVLVLLLHFITNTNHSVDRFLFALL